MPCGPSPRDRNWELTCSLFTEIADLFPAQAKTGKIAAFTRARPCARGTLSRVASAEADTIEGWLAYGAALNEGRGMFPSDELFGQWLVTNNLSDTVQAERAAAMWAAVNPDST